MHAVYLACLVGGLLATVVFAALGALGGAGHGAAHLHAGHALTHGHGGAGAPAHGAALGHGTTTGQAPAAWLGAAFGLTLSWINPLTLAAAALWFGGVGLLAESALAGAVVVLPLAVVAALLGAAAVRAHMAALVRSSSPPLRDGAAGALGTINAPIRADAVGEVIYTREGLRRSAPARSLDGQPLSRGTQVIIVRRERGIAWVSPLDPLASLPRGAEDVSPTRGSGDHGDLSPPDR